MADNQIDTSDIPELSEDVWATAVRGKFCKPRGQFGYRKLLYGMPVF